MMKRFLSILFVLVAATEAHAATICVTPASGCGTTQATVQAAVNAANAGDSVILHAGTTYTETITLPNKGVLASFITITTDASGGSLPAANVRTGPSFAAFMPKLQSPGGGASTVYFAPAANHYKFQHIEFLNVPQAFGEMVSFGMDDSTQQFKSQEPFTAIFDQDYFLGDAVAGQKRAIGFNGTDLKVTNSYFARIFSVGQDSQCIQGINGSGPLDVENNYLECATENFILGGGDPVERTFMHVSSPTTTSANVTAYETGHTLAELFVGQFIAIQTGTTSPTPLQYATISTITGTGASGSITWSPATTITPVVGGDIRAQVIPTGITFRKNWVTKDPNWFLGVMLAPAGPSATGSTSGGTLAAGQYCYQVQAFSLNGYQGNPVNSALATEQCATIASAGHVTVAFTAVTGATSYRIWRGTSPGLENQWTSVTAVSTSDDGTLVYTSATPFGATVVDMKNLFQLKCAANVQVDSNIFIHQRRGSDIGYAMWLKTVNQDGNGWACQTKNVTIEKNIWQDINGWVELHGQEGSGGLPLPGPMTNVTLRNNLVINSSYLNGGDIYSMNSTNSVINWTLDHNTIINVTDGQGGGLLVTDSTSLLSSGWVITNNMLRSETYGIHDPTASGSAALSAAAPGVVFTNNGVADATTPPYNAGSGNVYAALASWKAAFTVYTDDGSGGADYHILASGAGASYHNAGSDGKDIGADITLINTATAGVSAGTGSSVAITLPVLPTGVRTVAYSATETASGGTSPYTFAVTAGTAPAGLSLASGGTWSGTPTTTASYTFTVTATDNVAATTTQAYTVQILNPVTFSTTSPLPGGTLNAAYSTTLAYSGGAAPYTCTITAGSLPGWATLGASTCAITGTPNASATSTFTVTVTGALGSSAALACSLTVAGETLPVGRPVSTGPITHEAALFRRTTAPTAVDNVVRGDLWMDTSKDPPTINVALSQIPTWSLFIPGGAFSGDGSFLTNLNATQLLTGTIPTTAFPSTLPISSTLSAPTVTGAQASMSGYYEWQENACGSLSTSGLTRLCMDAADHILKVSQNGAAYTPIANQGVTTPSQLSNSDGTVTFQFSQTDNTDTYAMGASTGNGRSSTWSSLQGTLWQACRFHDATISTDYVWGCGVSNNAGSSWIFPWRVRQNGELHLQYPVLDSQPGTTCAAAQAGMINYVQGNATTKDIVQVCAHDASNVYAWRAIY